MDYKFSSRWCLYKALKPLCLEKDYRNKCGGLSRHYSLANKEKRRKVPLVELSLGKERRKKKSDDFSRRQRFELKRFLEAFHHGAVLVAR